MNVLLFGGTGMVGTEVLHLCLRNPKVSRVDSVIRSGQEISHEKLTEHRLEDFRNIGTLASVVGRADLCIYCVGVYQGMVSEEIFWEVTVSYLHHLLEVLEHENANPRFCLFSAQGADPYEKKRSPLFARAKGRAEVRLTESSISESYIFRPGFINPGRKAAKSRIPVWLARPIYKLFPSIGVDAVDLAGVMLNVGLNGSDRKVFENRHIREYQHKL